MKLSHLPALVVAVLIFCGPAQGKEVVGAWLDEPGESAIWNAKLHIYKEGGIYYFERVNSDSSKGVYKLRKQGNQYYVVGNRFGTYYTVTSKGLEIYDKQGYIRRASPIGKDVPFVAFSRGMIPKMVPIPEGRFDFGCEGKEVCKESEAPVIRLEVPAFYLSETEVTFELYDACVTDSGCTYRPSDKRYGRGKNPVFNVSWTDAQVFIKWLNEKTGRDFRLPTEVEWEYAARSGKEGQLFSTGSCIGAIMANIDGRKNTFGCERTGQLNRPAPVASYPANAFGLYDMHGNVFEWVQECWYASTNYVLDTKKRQGDCSRRVVRGGSWEFDARFARVSARNRTPTETRNTGIGFRLAEGG